MEPLQPHQCPVCGSIGTDRVVSEWWEKGYHRTRYECTKCEKKWTLIDD